MSVARYFVWVVILTVLLTSLAHAQSYTFINVADDTGPFNLFSPPQKNDGGNVGIAARTDLGDNGYYTTTGGVTTTIYSGSTGFLGNGAFPGMNDAGTVAFAARVLSTSVDGIFTGSGGTPSPVATDDASGPFSDFGTSGAVSINSSNTVLFHANLRAGGDGIFTTSGGITSAVADSKTPGFVQGFGSDPALNASGTIAFIANTTTGISIFRKAPGGAFTTIADTSGPFTTISSPSINAGGTVAFRGFTATDQGIYTGTGDAVSTVATTAGPYSGFLFAPQINDSGTIAFEAQLDDGRTGIFTGPDPLANAVIVTGSHLFGGTVTLVQFYRGLDNLGNIAFSYEISLPGGGTVDGIAVASVPEPASLGLLGCGAGLCLWRRRTR